MIVKAARAAIDSLKKGSSEALLVKVYAAITDGAESSKIIDAIITNCAKDKGIPIFLENLEVETEK